jgi:hypothetical protein
LTLDIPVVQVPLDGYPEPLYYKVEMNFVGEGFLLSNIEPTTSNTIYESPLFTASTGKLEIPVVEIELPGDTGSQFIYYSAILTLSGNQFIIESATPVTP